jgi:hypothetical protein
MSVSLMQYINGIFYIFDEVIIYGARTLDTLDEMMERNLILHFKKIIIHGDATGKSKSTKYNKSDYDIINEYLANLQNYNDFEFEIDVPASNPQVRKRHLIVNGLFCNANEEVKIFITKNCETTIKGFRLSKLKKGGQYIEDDSDYFQHITTAVGYGILRQLDNNNNINRLNQGSIHASKDIKRENVKRYLEKLFDKLGIEKDKQDLKNLNSVVKSTILGEFFYLTNYSSSFISRLTDFITSLYKVMSKDDEEYYFNSLVDIFKRIKRNRLDKSTLYVKNIKYIKSLEVDNSDKINEILKIFLKIGKSVSDYFNDKEINSIEDLKSIQLQLRMILDLSQDDIFYLSSFMANLLSVLDEDNLSVARRVIRTYSDEDYEKDLKKLEKLETIINRDFLKK